MSLVLRFATPDDVSTILRFIRELAEFEREADKVVATEALLHEAMFGERPVAEAVIAEMDGKPLGMALFFHNFSTWTGWRGLYLEDLYVTPEARGQGVGAALLRHLASIAVDRGCTRFEWAVLNWNEKAIDFYKAMGAKPMDDWIINRVSGDALTRLAGRG
jgi:GNAT superfamily N-acetyltransferase